jgi:hypothetical protein
MHDIKAMGRAEDLPVRQIQRKQTSFSIPSAAAWAPFASFLALGTLANLSTTHQFRRRSSEMALLGAQLSH